MRVTTGTARGMNLMAPPSSDVTRPTSDMTKQAMFNIVQFELEGAEQEYKINAITGTVFLDSLPGDLSDSTENDYQEDYYEEGQVENPGPMEDQ